MLKILIDGPWEVVDFVEVLKSVESLYYKTLPFSRARGQSFVLHDLYNRHAQYQDWLDEKNDWFLAESRMTVSGDYRFKIDRISYASPGSFDFTGFGAATRAVGEAIDRIIKLFTERRLRREKDKQASIQTQLDEIRLEKETQSLTAIKIENAQKLLQLYRDFSDPAALDYYDQNLIALAVRDQDKMIQRISEGKIVGVDYSESAD